MQSTINNSNNYKTESSEAGMSICIPRAFANITEARVRKVFEKLGIFRIARVDMVQRKNEKGDAYQRIFVHIQDWTETADAQKARDRLLAGKELKIVYDDPWFWKASLNTWAPKPKPETTVYDRKPRIRIEFEDQDAANTDAAAQLMSSLTLEDRRPYAQRRVDPVYCEQDVKSGFRDRREPRDKEPRDREPREPKKEQRISRFTPRSPSRSPVRNDRRRDEPRDDRRRDDRRRDEQPRDDRRIKITPDNVDKYIGYLVVFKNREGKENTTTILGVSQNKKTIYVDFPELQNNLQIVSRNVYLKEKPVVTSEKPRREENHESRDHRDGYGAMIYPEVKPVITTPKPQKPVVVVAPVVEVKSTFVMNPDIRLMVATFLGIGHDEVTEEMYKNNAQFVRDLRQDDMDRQKDEDAAAGIGPIDYGAPAEPPKRKPRKVLVEEKTNA